MRAKKREVNQEKEREAEEGTKQTKKKRLEGTMKLEEEVKMRVFRMCWGASPRFGMKRASLKRTQGASTLSTTIVSPICTLTNTHGSGGSRRRVQARSMHMK
jgi:hypothetical protein